MALIAAKTSWDINRFFVLTPSANDKTKPSNT